MFFNRIKSSISILIAGLVFCCLLVLPSSAASDDLVLSELPQERAADIFAGLQLQAINEPDSKTGFSSFDVNEKGEYLLGFNNSDTVLAYDENGAYLFGFTFDLNGSFHVRWTENGIVIYTFRSELAIFVDRNGDCLNIHKISDNDPENDNWINTLNAKERNINGTIYTAEHWLHNREGWYWGSYPRLVKILPNGEQVVLYESYKGTWEWLVFAGVIIIAAVVVMAVFLPKAVKITSRSLQKPRGQGDGSVIPTDDDPQS